jgi:5,10-methylenetetrahydromethanopterin reductase
MKTFTSQLVPEGGTLYDELGSFPTRLSRFVGFGIAPFATAEKTIQYALLAEKHNMHSFWLGEGYHGRSAISLLSSIAVLTKRIQLGTSVIGVYTRHPALIAMEAATIDELSQGRFNLGIGVSVSSLVKHAMTKNASTAKEQKPYAAMKDSLIILRGLLSGQKVVYRGQVFSLSEPGSSLDFHGFRPVRSDMPIYVGGRSALTLELGGRFADGIILSRSLSSSDSYVKDSLEHAFRGAKKAGRDERELVIAANLNFSVDKDSQSAKDHVREVVALYIADPTLTAEELMLQHSKVRPEDMQMVKSGLQHGGIQEAARMVTPEMIDEFAVAGTVDECIKKIQRLIKLGVNLPIAFDIIGPNPEQAIRLISEEIVPLIKD